MVKCKAIGKISTALAAAALLLAASPAFASSNDLQGSFSGKVICQSGKKRAIFKSPTGSTLLYFSSDQIKQRIDAVTWPNPEDTTTFSDREKEKTTLQKAVKLLRQLDCDAGETTSPDAAGIAPDAATDATTSPDSSQNCRSHRR